MSVSRQIRRAAERQNRKNLRKQMKSGIIAPETESNVEMYSNVQPASTAEAASCGPIDTPESHPTDEIVHAIAAERRARFLASLQANRANAQRSRALKPQRGKPGPVRTASSMASTPRNSLSKAKTPLSLTRFKADLLAEHQPPPLGEMGSFHRMLNRNLASFHQPMPHPPGWLRSL